MVSRIRALAGQKLPQREIVQTLNGEKLFPRKGRWHQAMLSRIMIREGIPATRPQTPGCGAKPTTGAGLRPLSVVALRRAAAQAAG